MFLNTENLHIMIGYGWLFAALLLIILEVGTPGLFFFISLAIGAACTAPFAFLEYSFFVQAGIWLASSLVALMILRWYTKKSSLASSKTNAQALIGQTATVTKKIESTGAGYVKVRGEFWPAITQHGIILHPGTVVTVIGIQGNKLIVISAHGE